jgi:hypothetical protein
MPVAIYFPDRDERWERRAPGQVGLDPDRLAAAVEFAAQHETPWSRDLHAVLSENNQGEGPHGAIVGPVKPRGGDNTPPTTWQTYCGASR